MHRSGPLLVYLDSQDYSRFGDVLRGRASGEVETLYERLLAMRASGDVAFAYSMPILAELLQFEEAFAETSFRKAEAVEALCGGNALIYPGRLVALEVARVAAANGLGGTTPAQSAHSTDGNWYPDVSGTLENLREQMLSEATRQISDPQLGNRAARRLAKKKLKSLDLADFVRGAAPEMAAKYDLPIGAVEGSFVALLEGRINAEQASRRLFAAIAAPTSFVNVYFRRYEGEKTLPHWLRDLGSQLQATIETMRANVAPLLSMPGAHQAFMKVLADLEPKVASAVLVLGRGEKSRGGPQELVDRVAASPKLLSQVPVCQITGALVHGYLLQTTGATGVSKVEHSFGGDLVHSFYLSHVDLWRGDRRFSHLVREHLPEVRDKVVAKLSDLPSTIEARLARSPWRIDPTTPGSSNV